MTNQQTLLTHTAVIYNMIKLTKILTVSQQWQKPSLGIAHVLFKIWFFFLWLYFFTVYHAPQKHSVERDEVTQAWDGFEPTVLRGVFHTEPGTVYVKKE